MTVTEKIAEYNAYREFALKYDAVPPLSIEEWSENYGEKDDVDDVKLMAAQAELAKAIKDNKLDNMYLHMQRKDTKGDVMVSDKKYYSHKQWNRLLDETISNINKLSKLKGGEYAGDDDRLANFRRNAEAYGVTKELIWGVYAGKHWDAIQQYVKDKQTGKERERGEPISGRLDDLIVYCILMKAMVEEDGVK